MFRAARANSPAEALRLLTDALTTYEDWFGHTPTNLNHLVEKKMIDRLPAPPAGRRFVVDPQKHEVVLGNP